MEIPPRHRATGGTTVVGYTDAEGNVYDALPDGDYTISVVLRDDEGHELASANKKFSIQPPQATILCRFHLDEHYEKMKKFAAEKAFP